MPARGRTTDAYRFQSRPWRLKTRPPGVGITNSTEETTIG